MRMLLKFMIPPSDDVLSCQTPVVDRIHRRAGLMLHGRTITLRPMREADVDAMYAAHVDIRNRGAFFPLGVMSESAFRSQFGENGFWQKEEGTLVIVSPEDEIAGHIEFFKPVGYWDAFELSYQLYDDRFAGRGYTTEAVQLLTDYLFATKKQHRVQLVIVPDNGASRRIAEKCGFQLEGTVRGAFFNDGQNQDVLLYSLLRDDPRPWHGEGGRGGAAGGSGR
jgi:ribosomal-protein-alanine N-acetyltransferase